MTTALETGAASQTSLRKDWTVAGLVTLVALVAICLNFSQEVVGAYRVWMDSTTYNHCFLIIPITIYMIWRRRDRLRGLRPAPDFRVLIPLFLLSLAWFAASLVGILEAQQFVVLTIMQAVIFGLMGAKIYGRLIGPLLYLYFLVPSGDYLVPVLQDFTARFAILGLQMLGIPVFSDGTMIEIPNARFVVAEACAGLRFLIASVAFGVFFASETYQSWRKRLAFIGLSIVVPIVANGLRALGLVLIGYYSGDAAAVEADHLTFGWVFFSLVLLALIFIGRSFADPEESSVMETAPVVPGPRSTTRTNTMRFALAGVAFLLGAMIVPATASAFLGHAAGILARDLRAPVSPPWRRVDGAMSLWRPIVINADSEILETFTDGRSTVHRFMALYAPRGQGDNLIRSGNRLADENVWRRGPGVEMPTSVGDQATQLTVTEMVARGNREAVTSVYVVDGIVANSAPEAKWRQVLAYLRGTPCTSAFVAIGTPVGEGGAPGAREILQSFLTAMEAPRATFCGPG